MSEIISFCQSRRSPPVQSRQDNVAEIKLDYATYASQSRFEGKAPPPTLLMQGSGRFDGVFTFAGTFDGRPAYQRGTRCFLHFCAPRKREGRYFGFVCCGLLFNTAHVHHIRSKYHPSAFSFYPSFPGSKLELKLESNTTIHPMRVRVML